MQKGVSCRTLAADQPGQLAIGHPQSALPVQHIQRLPLPQAATRAASQLWYSRGISSWVSDWRRQRLSGW
jgi:hypothetical protein